MKELKSIKVHLWVYFISLQVLSAQEAFHNFGELQFHNDALVGFHLDLINDGTFENNQGLAGFYSTDPLRISGLQSPVFNDLEVVADNNLLLNIGVDINSNVNFVVGDIQTIRNVPNNTLNFINSAFYVGSNDDTHVNGYVSATNKELISFPVGDGDRLRPLTMASSAINATAKCAYFYEDPNAPTSILQQFNTSEKETDELQISETEFWRLEADQPSVITISWNSESSATLLAEVATNLLVVGWSKTQNQWVSLGNSSITGNLESGSITSETFVPNDYEIVTLGGTNDILEPFTVLNLDNYFMTPNDDGVNEFLLIDGIENFPNNVLNIYDRYGVLVYSKLNYANGFNGESNSNGNIERNKKLASGVYFYVLTISDIKEKYQGYLYISN